ncbi:hypothetical protein [Chitinophaga sp. S165]|uniref:hypothetical protein n=1 Tax=Chitinophaga sp. S165 TaxID=2135462 RepID=UPI000D8E778A|nr:hypothetical protein [Chitinophaga sp. S165]PWV50721.1 hypothetical protein C7475_104351 [Chitinophaga sp. S165]
MNALMERKKETILNSFEEASDDYWKTLGEIATSSRIKLDDVVKIVLSSREFLEASYREKDGEPVFTTRNVYRKRASFWQKLLSAVTDRIV